jgi:hypothetical protein
LLQKVQNVLDGVGQSVRWRVEVSPELELLADPDQIFRVFLNLARNAVEAMAEGGGVLTIAAEPGPETLAIDVADTGPGIPERVRARLFEPFAGSAKPGGNGLGLAICRELMRAHGGEIELLETSPAGTTFRLLLPARTVLRASAARRPAMSAEAVVRLVLPLLLLLAGCGIQGPGLAGYPGLQWKVISFYDRWAMEKAATCPQPRMQAVTRAEVVEETAERVVMNIRYHWIDEGQIDTDDGFGVMPALQRCDDWGERTFTFVKRTDGSLDVVAMTGPQRDR